MYLCDISRQARYITLIFRVNGEIAWQAVPERYLFDYAFSHDENNNSLINKKINIFAYFFYGVEHFLKILVILIFSAVNQ